MKENKYLKKINYKTRLTFIVIMATLFVSANASAQNGTTYMRIAKIVVDSAQLKSYKAALKKQMKSALTLEEGVLAYSAVYDKNNPSHITILETYAGVAGYRAHIQTEHFKKYKTSVETWLSLLN